MALVTNSLFLDIFLGLLAILYLIYWYFTRNNDYWDKRGVRNSKKDLLLRNLFAKESQNDSVLDMYKQFRNERFAGHFQMGKQILMVRDPELINRILVKDFIHFQNRGNSRRFENDPLFGSLFNLDGQKWRTLRYKLTPTFTTGKLKGMFEQLSTSGDNMIDRIEEHQQENKEFDSRELMFEFSLDVIASCAFGLQFKPKSPEFATFKNIVQSLLNTSIETMIRFTVLFLIPALARFLKMTSFSKPITEYFVNLTKATLKYRKDNNIQRKDYFQQLLTLKEQEESEKEIALTSSSDTTEDDTIINQMHYTEQSSVTSITNIKVMTEEVICSNTFIFLLAGSETVATTISFTLLNLAQHSDIQCRLQEEVDSSLKKHNGWSYDTVKDMCYLDQVVQETLRIYPLVPMLIRECVNPYKVAHSDLVIEKGTLISIPVAGLHMDPQYYPDPERFNPDRFEGNNFKPSSTFLPFGDGPRICIGMRFALLEVKTCLARILSQYTVTLSPKTQLPIKFKKDALVVAPEGGVWLNFKKRKSL